MVPELGFHSGDLDFHRGDFGFDVDKIILRSKDKILELPSELDAIVSGLILGPVQIETDNDQHSSGDSLREKSRDYIVDQVPGRMRSIDSRMMTSGESDPDRDKKKNNCY
jgi:hypothetical protein